MSFDSETLYKLLPAVYRIRDGERGEPLRALLGVIADQVQILEESLTQLYEDQFVETAAPWVMPYLGDLIGLTGLPGASGKGLTPRAEVANTLSYRRRKGTVAMLEQLARDVTGWPARAVESFQLLATTQHLNHLRAENQALCSVRDAERLERLGGAFEKLARPGDLARGARRDPRNPPGALPVTPGDITHTADVRLIATRRGRYNIPNVGLWLWRLQALSLTRSPAVPAAPGDERRFRLHPLGIDAPLFSRPETETDAGALAEAENVPQPLGRRALARTLGAQWGRSGSLLLEIAAATPGPAPAEVPAADVTVCDLGDVPDGGGGTVWAHTPPVAAVAIDPVRGRVAFRDAQTRAVLATVHHGFPAELGGGEYDRVRSFVLTSAPLRVASTEAAAHATVSGALAALPPAGGVVEIADSGRYPETPAVNAGAAGRIELRAADQNRPLVRLGGTLVVSGGADAEVTLSGLLIVGGGVRVTGGLRRLRIRHCTLVPGLDLFADGEPASPSEPSLVVDSPKTTVEIEDSIVGGIRAVETAEVQATRTVLDACAEVGVAYAALDGAGFGAPVRLESVTVIGKLKTARLELASNTIFLAALDPADLPAVWPGPVLAERRQEGCVRFSYLPAGARVPRRHRCQPEREADAGRLRPHLRARRIGDPSYAQLSERTPVEIARGADDESQMGAYHDLFEPQRLAHLQARLQEYLRFGLEAGIFFAS
jgi:hypothetical protein